MTLLADHTGHVGVQAGHIMVKTCGIMRVEHALVAAARGANMIGLVFARSKRAVSPDLALSVRRALDSSYRNPLLVGVFVNEEPGAVFEIADRVGLDILQLSGDETPDDVARYTARYPVFKTFRFPKRTTAKSALHELRRYRHAAPASRLKFLVDSYHPGEYGGTGLLSDWGIAAELAREEDIILAGGLTPVNVSLAVSAVKPWGVDVSSGIERDGVKDAELIGAFVREAKCREMRNEK